MTGSLIAFFSAAIVISLLVVHLVFESALNVGLNAAVQLPQPQWRTLFSGILARSSIVEDLYLGSVDAGVLGQCATLTVKEHSESDYYRRLTIFEQIKFRASRF